MLDNKLRTDNLDLLPKAAKPGEELVRDFYFWIDGEVRIIRFVVMQPFRAKAIHHGIEQRIDEPQRHANTLAAEHSKLNVVEHLLTSTNIYKQIGAADNVAP